MRTRHLAAVALLTSAALAARDAGAQGPAVNSAPNTIELGIDAGATIGLGSDSYFTIAAPAQRARVGFFLNNETRWSLEPAFGLIYADSEGADGSLLYDLDLGALYHFRSPQEVYSATRATVSYVRPFLNFQGQTGGGSDSRVTVGAGLGIKVPWRGNIAWRLEGNLGYDLDNDAARFGALVGLSFFTRRGG
jgi:hypothetical protein